MRPWANPVIWQEAQALMALPHDLEEAFQKAVGIFHAITGRVVCTGVGKSGHVARKVASTLASTGTPAFFLHPTEAGHGDLGAIVKEDALFGFSRSGRAEEIQSVFEYAMGIGVPIVLVSENDVDSLADIAETVLKMPAIQEAWGHAPTTSTIMQMAIGDAVAVTLAQMRGFTDENFLEIHPAGELGKKRLKMAHE